MVERSLEGVFAFTIPIPLTSHGCHMEGEYWFGTWSFGVKRGALHI